MNGSKFNKKSKTHFILKCQFKLSQKANSINNLFQNTLTIYFYKIPNNLRTAFLFTIKCAGDVIFVTLFNSFQFSNHFHHAFEKQLTPFDNSIK